MKLLACIKQVPDSGETLFTDPQSGWIAHSPSTVFRMNRFDEFALEEALLLKERHPKTSVHALSVGPSRAGSTVRRAMEMGSDHGILILDPEEGYKSPYRIASYIAAYARTMDYDLIVTGVMAEDDMACQTGQLIAAILDMPCATSVISTEIRPGERRVVVEREIEGGRRLTVEMDMPAVLTIQSGINMPRYPSLSNVLRARTQQQELVRVEDLPAPPLHEDCIGVHLPDPASMGDFLRGTPAEKARTLVRILHERALRQ
jgi:electron transfer flavoprotein beta subunit